MLAYLSVIEWFISFTCLCTFSFACPKEKDTKKQRAPSAFLRLRRMASSLKDRNSLRSNSLSFLTGVCLSLFYASKMSLRLRRMPSSLKDRNSLRSNSLSFLTGVSLSLFYASKMRTGVEVGFPLRHANRTIPYYNMYLIYIWRTE